VTRNDDSYALALKPFLPLRIPTNGIPTMSYSTSIMRAVKKGFDSSPSSELSAKEKDRQKSVNALEEWARNVGIM